MRHLFVLALAVGLGAPLTHAAEREFFGLDTFHVDPNARITVTTDDVEIHLRSADVPEVRFSTDLRIAGLGADKADAWLAGRMPNVEEAPSLLRITSAPDGEGFLGFGSFLQRKRFGIVAPQTCTPDLTSGSAAISVRGAFPAAEPVRLRSGDGAITFVGTASSFEIKSTSGDSSLELMAPAEKLWARTSAGGIRLSGGARSVQIETASGTAELSNLVGSATVETVDGDIVLSWDRLPADASVTVVSSRGNIRLRIPLATRPSGKLSTSTGSIRSEFPGTVSEAGDAVDLAGPGPRFTVETASGDILLEKDPGWFASDGDESGATGDPSPTDRP